MSDELLLDKIVPWLTISKPSFNGTWRKL